MAATVYLSLAFLAIFLVGLLVRRFVFLRDRSQMEQKGRLVGRMIARAEEVAPGSVKKFWLICQRYRIDCFLVNDRGTYHAYINRCRHMATPLDFVRSQFFTEDGRHLVCMMHGATYEPHTGLCIDGPCKGLALYRLPVLVDQGRIMVGCPEGDLSFLVEWAD